MKRFSLDAINSKKKKKNSTKKDRAYRHDYYSRIIKKSP